MMNHDLMYLLAQVAAPIASFQLKAACRFWFHLFESNTQLLDVHVNNLLNPKRWILNNCTNLDLIRQSGVRVEHWSVNFGFKLIQFGCDESTLLYLFDQNKSKVLQFLLNRDTWQMAFELYKNDFPSVKPKLIVDVFRSIFANFTLDDALFLLDSNKFSTMNQDELIQRHSTSIAQLLQMKQKSFLEDKLDCLIIKHFERIWNLVNHCMQSYVNIIHPLIKSSEVTEQILDFLMKIDCLSPIFFQNWVWNDEMKMWMMKNNQFDQIFNIETSVLVENISFNKEFFTWFTSHPRVDEFLQKKSIKLNASDLFRTSDEDVVKWLVAKFESKINELLSEVVYDGQMMNVMMINLWESKGGRIDWLNSYTDSAAVYKYAIEQGHRFFVSYSENCYELYEQCDENLMMGQIKIGSVTDYITWCQKSPTLHHRKTTTSHLTVKQKICNTLMFLINRFGDDPNVMELIQSYAVQHQIVPFVRKLIQMNRFKLSSIDDKSIKVWSKMMIE